MDRASLIVFLESLEPHLAGLTEAQRYAICQQSGALRNTAVGDVVHSGTVEDLRRLRAELSAGGSIDGVAAAEPQAPHAMGSAEPSAGDGAAIVPADVPEAGNGAVTEAADGDGPLPMLTVPAILEGAGFAMSGADAETAQFILETSVASLWRLAYADPAAVDEQTALAADGAFAECVRAAFRSQFEAARALPMPVGWDFRSRDGGIIEPNLMQRHVAVQIATRRRVGNWSGTGAGKTVSAVLGARVIGAGTEGGVVLVVCPNNTVAGWTKTITGCFPDSRVAAGTLRPEWQDGEGPRFLVVNYEAFQRAQSAALLRDLLSGPNRVRLDMIVIDEIHFAKVRGSDRRAAVESTRRRNLAWTVEVAGRCNPGLAVLGMSATPVINDLTEGRSALELIHGAELADQGTRATEANVQRMHQRFVLAGSRWLPEYRASLQELAPTIACDALLDELLALGPGAPVSKVERILLRAKIPLIVDECLAARRRGSKAFVYTEFVVGIVEPLREALVAAGLETGVFTGGDKSGLEAFVGGSADVLIGTSAISTGVDGLQHVCDTVVFAVLPWTAAGREQVLGRVHRTGQQAAKVRVVTPLTAATTATGPDGAAWSWCQRRLALIGNKKLLADAVLDGVRMTEDRISRRKVADALLGWLHRIKAQDADSSGDFRELDAAA